MRLKMGQMGRIGRVGRIVLPVLVVVGLWYGVIGLWDMPRFILPSPGQVILTLYDSRVVITENAVVTMGEVLAGIALGAFLGGLSAIGLAMSPLARTLFRPLLVLTQALPVFALAPILTLWFGYGFGSKVAMALLIIYFPVTSAFYDALMRAPADWLALARIMGATPLNVMWHIRIPAALPGFLSGLRLAAVYAPIGAIIGEWVGASKGLGYLMLLANGRAKTDLMFAAVLVLAVFTLGLYKAIDALSDEILRRREGR